MKREIRVPKLKRNKFGRFMKSEHKVGETRYEWDIRDLSEVCSAKVINYICQKSLRKDTWSSTPWWRGLSGRETDWKNLLIELAKELNHKTHCLIHISYDDELEKLNEMVKQGWQVTRKAYFGNSDRWMAICILGHNKQLAEALIEAENQLQREEEDDEEF